jgi:50S ribosomal subunit-associated GTPase HflX
MNKIDCLSPDALDLLEKSWQAQTRYPTAFLSATHKVGLDAFYQTLTALLREVQRHRQNTLPTHRPGQSDNLLQ